jgi:hypothetical protein
MEGWYSMRCRLTWKLKATKSSRLYFQLAPSTLPTDGIESGLLHTVKLTDCRDQRELTDGKNISKTTGVEYGLHLTQLAKSGLLPTPQAMQSPDKTEKVLRLKEQGLPLTTRAEGDNSRQYNITDWMIYHGLLATPNSRDWKGELGHEGQKDLNRDIKKMMLPTPDCSDRRSMNSKQQGLSNVVKTILLPTPAASNHKGGCTRTDPERQNDTLAHAIHGLTDAPTGKTSQLNPRFVAEMMGFPPEYLELPFLNTETNP